MFFLFFCTSCSWAHFCMKKIPWLVSNVHVISISMPDPCNTIDCFLCLLDLFIKLRSNFLGFSLCYDNILLVCLFMSTSISLSRFPEFFLKTKTDTFVTFLNLTVTLVHNTASVNTHWFFCFRTNDRKFSLSWLYKVIFPSLI